MRHEMIRLLFIRDETIRAVLSNSAKLWGGTMICETNFLAFRLIGFLQSTYNSFGFFASWLVSSYFLHLWSIYVCLREDETMIEFGGDIHVYIDGRYNDLAGSVWECLWFLPVWWWLPKGSCFCWTKCWWFIFFQQVNIDRWSFGCFCILFHSLYVGNTLDSAGSH